MINSFRGIFGQESVKHFDYLQLQRDGLDVGDINRRFVRAALDLKPDWIWLQLQETDVIQAESIANISSKLPCVITHWTGDCRKKVTPYLSSICKATHFTYVSNKGQRQQFFDAGANRFGYLQIGVDFEEDVLGVPNWEPSFTVPDVVFCGNFYGDTFKEGTDDRLRAIRALKDAGIDVGVVGGNWPSDIPAVGTCGVKQQYHVWKRAKIALNVNHFNNIASYYSDRQLIAMASGTATVCHYVPGLEDEFTDRVDCAFFRNDGELLSIVDYLLGEDGIRVMIGRNGRSKVIKEHTWYSRILSVLPEVEQLRQGITR